MDVVNLDQLNYSRAALEAYDYSTGEITVTPSSWYGDSISTHNSDGSVKSMREILNDLDARLAALEEKERARESECVCDSLL